MKRTICDSNVCSLSTWFTQGTLLWSMHINVMQWMLQCTGLNHISRCDSTD